MLKSSDDIMLFNTVCLTQQCLRIPHKKWPNVSKDVLCKMTIMQPSLCKYMTACKINVIDKAC